MRSTLPQAALNSGKSDFNKAALTFIMGHAIQCAACTPLVEKLNVPMGGIIGSGLVILGLGQLTQLGILKPEHLTNVAIFAYCVISLQELLMPKPTLEAFGFPDATAVTKMLMGSYATVKVRARDTCPARHKIIGICRNGTDVCRALMRSSKWARSCS